METRKTIRAFSLSPVVSAFAALCLVLNAHLANAQSEQGYRQMVDQYCVVCHNQRTVDADPSAITDPLGSQLRAVG